MNRTGERILIALWSALLMLISFWDLLRHPGSAMLNLGGDGTKNYFTYLFHCLYGKGIWFDGMNYPYGEHLFYVDAQPLYSILFVSCRAWLGMNEAHALGLMHLGICVSFFLAVNFQYKILRLWGLPIVLSLIVASCIAYMSPQLLRLYGHYSLAYPSFPAMLCYYTFKYEGESKVKYALFIFLLALTMYLLHPYFLAISLFWIGAYSLGTLIARRRDKLSDNMKSLFPIGLAGIALVLIVFTFMALSDPISDRPEFPYGATAYCVTGAELISSSYSPFWQLLQSFNVITDPCSGGEGFGYPGIVVLLTLLFLIYVLLRKKKYLRLSSAVAEIGVKWWLMSFFFLLLAMGVPFVWNMEWLLRYLGPFRQFRSLGRFVFLFYQLIAVISCVLLWKWYQVSEWKKRQWLLIVAVAFWTWEASGCVLVLRHLASQSRHNFQEFATSSADELSSLLQNRGYHLSDVQSILLMPFVHTGSDKWFVGNSKESVMYHGFRASLFSGIPLINVQIPRHSWSQTATQVRIAGGPFAQQDYFAALSSTRPILLLTAPGQELTPDEQYLVDISSELGRFMECKAYLLEPSTVLARARKIQERIKVLLAGIKGVDTVVPGSKALFYSEHFDKQSTANYLCGTGGLAAIHNRRQLDTLLLEREIGVDAGPDLYEISTWVLINKSDYRTPVLNLSLLDEEGKEIFRQDALAKESVDNFGMWFRVNLYFRFPPQARRLVWRLYDQKEGSYLAIDELLLRSVNDTVLHRSANGLVMVNNHLMRF